MKIAIIGASGFVGSHLLTEALYRGHEVKAIVRNPSKITLVHPNLKIVAGDVTNAATVAELITGQDLVISAYNPGWQNPEIYRDFIAGSNAILEGVKKSGVKRIIVIGGAGSLETASGTQYVDTPQFPAEWKSGALAARDFLNILKKEKEIDWTFFSPALLMHHGIHTGRTGNYRLGLNHPVVDEKGVSTMSGEDVAVVILDEAENRKFIRTRFTAAY
jgi:putative NADH-flavin reductase